MREKRIVERNDLEKSQSIHIAKGANIRNHCQESLHWRERDATVEAEVGVMWGHNPRNVGSLELEKARSWILPRASTRSAVLPAHVRLLNWEMVMLCCFKPLCWR